MKNLLKTSLIISLLSIMFLACEEDKEENPEIENPEIENFIQVGNTKYSLSQGILDYEGRVSFNVHETKHHLLFLLPEGMSADNSSEYFRLDEQSNGMLFKVVLRSTNTEDITEKFYLTHNSYSYSQYSLAGTCGLIVNDSIENGLRKNHQGDYTPKEMLVDVENNIFTVSFNGNHDATNDTIFGYFRGRLDDFNPNDLINPETGEYDPDLDSVKYLTIN